MEIFTKQTLVYYDCACTKTCASQTNGLAAPLYLPLQLTATLMLAADWLL